MLRLKLFILASTSLLALALVATPIPLHSALAKNGGNGHAGGSGHGVGASHEVAGSDESSTDDSATDATDHVLAGHVIDNKTNSSAYNASDVAKTNALDNYNSAVHYSQESTVDEPAADEPDETPPPEENTTGDTGDTTVDGNGDVGDPTQTAAP